MAEANRTKRARAMFAELLHALDEMGRHYEKDVENLVVNCGLDGDDMPIELALRIDRERELAILLSPLPFEVPENSREEFALVAAALNRGEADGFFDYDYRYGRLVFRMTFNFKGGKLLRETLVYMIVSACNKVNALNGRIMYAAMSPEPYKAFTAYAG